MRHAVQKIVYLIGFVFIGTQLFAQNSHIRSQGYWTLGLNGGWAYQQSDTKANFDGYGVGLTLAKNLAYRPGAPLSFDLRGRFLYANTYGLDGTRSYGILNNTALNGTNGVDYTTEPGFTYYNHNTKIGELALEGVVHLNRLRERTHFDISVFGGIGLDYYNTKNNFLGTNGTYATDFAAIDPNLSTSSARSQVRSILDDTYETKADGFGEGGKINIMPSLGAELYYWFTPKFALGVAHKATWARADDLDGQQWNASNELTAENDIYHYTNIGAKWIIEPSRRRAEEPFINITDPQMNPFESPTSNGFVRAEIGNVEKDQVRCLVNGRNSRFDMYGEKFTVNFPLRPGRNEVVITASNSAGRAEAVQIINFQNTYTPPPPSAPIGDRPYVVFVNPPQQGYRVDTERFTIEATIENVNRSGDIQLAMNGRRVSNFDYNPRTNRLLADVNLKNGTNTIKIRAKNSAGETTEQTTVIVDTNVPNNSVKPTVQITRPSSSPYETTSRTARVEARIKHIEKTSDIKVFIRGRRSNNFDFNTRTGQLISNVNLEDGYNKVVIEASNAAGNASDQVTIVYKTNVVTPPPTPPAPTVRKPNVRITSVPTPQAGDCRTTVKASITNINSFRDISFKVNGQRITNFEYNPNTDKFLSTISLREGNNTIFIEARNTAGKDSDSKSVRCSGGLTSGGSNNNKPTVTITTPSSQSTTTNESNAVVQATIKNIDSKNDITFIVNGQRKTNFTYSTSSDKFSANVTLKTGNNDIIIKAVNKYGKGEDNAAIRYIRGIGTPTAPPKPPTVDITKPSNNSTASQASTQVKATIKNISSKSGLTLLVNGRGISSFNYSGGILNATIALKEGNNTILVKAQNTDGKAQDQVTVKYQAPLPKPTVRFTNPARSGSTTEKAAITVKGTVKNVSSKNNITLKLNGRAVKGFSYNAGSGLVSTNLTLKEGKNTLELLATNSSGSARASTSITYAQKVVVQQSNRPTVKIESASQPTTNPMNPTVGRSSVIATVKGVRDKRGITFTVNGKKITDYEYTPRSGFFKAVVDLERGNNVIKIVAKNSSGQAQDSTTVSF